MVVVQQATTTAAAAAKEMIQEQCIARMLKGGLTPKERMNCFKTFRDTLPSSKWMQKFYDAWASDYDSDMLMVKHTNPSDVVGVLSNLIPNLNNERASVSVLDVGAGTGEGGSQLVQGGFANVHATDGSPGMLKQAERLGVYSKILPTEMLVKGQPMRTIAPETYDVIYSAGAFYPAHLQGEHLKCFLDCAKTNGLIVVSAYHRCDVDGALYPVIQELVEAGVIEVLEEVYVTNWTVWALKKLTRFQFPRQQTQTLHVQQQPKSTTVSTLVAGAKHNKDLKCERWFSDLPTNFLSEKLAQLA